MRAAPRSHRYCGATRERRAASRPVWKSTSVGYTRQFFTKSFLGDDAAVLASSSGEETTLSRHREQASRTCRKILISTQVEAHAGADLQPPVLAFALATARARLVRDRLVVAFSRLGVNSRRVELASMRPRAPATRVEVYLRLRDGATEVEVPARPTDGAPPHALTRHVPRVWRRRRAWPLSRLLNVATKWLGAPSGVLRE